MRRLIPAVSKVQTVFHSIGIRESVDFPMIAVVGSQACGKSSILQGIVGHDFLPVGRMGFSTRRPIEITLKQVSEGEPMRGELRDPLFETQHPRVRYKKHMSSFDEIRESLEHVLEMTAPQQCVARDPIYVTIYANDVIDNLVLVDLPGLTKNPIGTAPRNVEYILKKMVQEYISKKNCLILAVASASCDIAGSEAIKFVKMADPAGRRSLGVLTKIDIMDRGTDCVNVITGRVLPMRGGFCGVINRSFADCRKGKSLAEAIREERDFFVSNPRYSPFADRMGIPYLVLRINRILLAHIRQVLPELKSKIHSLQFVARRRLEIYGEPIPPSDDPFSDHLMPLLVDYAHHVTDRIEGRYVANPDDENDDVSLSDGAGVREILFDQLPEELMRLDPFAFLTESLILRQLQQSRGPMSSLFIPPAAFRALVRRNIERFDEPVVKALDHVRREMERLVTLSVRAIPARFDKVRDRVRDVSISFVRSCEKPLRRHVETLLQCEKECVNPHHPDLLAPSVDREWNEVEALRSLVVRYVSIIRKQLCDTIPKAAMYFLVSRTVEDLHVVLLRDFHRSGMLLKEDEAITLRRRATKKMLSILTRAEDVLLSVSRFSPGVSTCDDLAGWVDEYEDERLAWIDDIGRSSSAYFPVSRVLLVRRTLFGWSCFLSHRRE